MSDEEDMAPEKFMLIPPNEDQLHLPVGFGPEYDQMLLAEAAKYKTGEFIELRPITAVSET